MEKLVSFRGYVKFFNRKIKGDLMRNLYDLQREELQISVGLRGQALTKNISYKKQNEIRDKQQVHYEKYNFINELCNVFTKQFFVVEISATNRTEAFQIFLVLIFLVYQVQG